MRKNHTNTDKSKTVSDTSPVPVRTVSLEKTGTLAGKVFKNIGLNPMINHNWVFEQTPIKRAKNRWRVQQVLQ